MVVIIINLVAFTSESRNCDQKIQENFAVKFAATDSKQFFDQHQFEVLVHGRQIFLERDN